MDPEEETLFEGAVFESKKKLIAACRTYAVQQNIEFETSKSSNTHYKIKCKNANCSWSLYAVNIENTHGFSIRKYNHEHPCFSIIHTSHKQVTEAFIANRIQVKLMQRQSYTPKEIQEDLKCELNVDVTYGKAWRAKELAIKNINGTHEESYSKLPKYCEDLVNTNPGTVAFIESTDESKFKRMFVSFGASLSGFTYCHPLLGLDGTHLKSKYIGILLAATGVDVMGQLFPLAFAVVDAENDSNWLWFLDTLCKSIITPHAPGFLENDNFVLLSDHQKDLIDGIGTVFPDSPHG